MCCGVVDVLAFSPIDENGIIKWKTSGTRRCIDDHVRERRLRPTTDVFESSSPPPRLMNLPPSQMIRFTLFQEMAIWAVRDPISDSERLPNLHGGYRIYLISP